MPEKSLCKGCSQNVHVAKKEIEALLEMQTRSFSNLVTDAIYQERLEKCNHCPYLLYGTTCQYCGCLVQYKAKFPEKHCASPDNPQW